MDEPSLGLAPVVVDIVFNALQQLNREGLTLILVEQNARRALEITDTALVIEQGKIVQRGKSRQLLNDSQIIAHYLGQTA